MRLVCLLSLLACFSIAGCGGGSTEVKPLQGEVVTSPALQSGDTKEAAPQAPGLVD